jgi:protein tyrosine phosphatase (PTP) superfamily phosphohydrolase (DUF442 family)
MGTIEDRHRNHRGQAWEPQRTDMETIEDKLGNQRKHAEERSIYVYCRTGSTCDVDWNLRTEAKTRGTGRKPKGTGK